MLTRSLVVVVVVAIAAMGAGCGRRSSGGGVGSAASGSAASADPLDVDATIAEAQSAIAQAEAFKKTLVPTETPAQHIDTLGYADALAYAQQTMTDETSEDGSDGTFLFTYWASKHLRWSDVSVQKDETSFALVRKDSDSARGKRLCTSGQVIQIQVHKMPTAGKISVGLLMSNAGNIYHFFAAASSGELVSDSYARFCGVVTGTYDYSNSAGGSSHAVDLVGMFDLPENKPKK